MHPDRRDDGLAAVHPDPSAEQGPVLQPSGALETADLLLEGLAGHAPLPIGMKKTKREE
jgi:hypothetical protein